MELLIFTILTACILGGLLGFLLYKNEQRFDQIMKYTQDKEKKIRDRGSKERF